jgi:ABC-2 type transport system permease protein
MYTVMAVALMFFRPESIGQLLEMPMFADYVQRMAPLVAAVFMALSSTTTCSISLEGRGLWIAKSLPVGTMTVFLSKILVNLSITLPAVFVNGLLLMMALKTGFLDSILLFLVPGVYAVFVSLMGLVVNLHFPYLDWVSETQAVKQSAATLISMLLGIASIAVPLTLLIKFSALNAQLVASGTVVLLALVSAGLYSYLASKGESLLQRL